MPRFACYFGYKLKTSDGKSAEEFVVLRNPFGVAIWREPSPDVKRHRSGCEQRRLRCLVQGRGVQIQSDRSDGVDQWRSFCLQQFPATCSGEGSRSEVNKRKIRDEAIWIS
jgi:hypothetical protein